MQETSGKIVVKLHLRHWHFSFSNFIRPPFDHLMRHIFISTRSYFTWHDKANPSARGTCRIRLLVDCAAIRGTSLALSKDQESRPVFGMSQSGEQPSESLKHFSKDQYYSEVAGLVSRSPGLSLSSVVSWSYLLRYRLSCKIID
jgi:hypothetical protein